MTKQEWNEVVRKTKWASKKKRLSKGELIIVQKGYQTLTKKAGDSGSSTWKGKSEPMKLGNVLNTMKILGKQ